MTDTYAFREPKPFQHQVRALHKIAQTGGCTALVMDPGTGKTRVVVDYLGALATKHGPQDWLVTAPLSALDTWPDQFRQWLPEHLTYEVVEPTGTVQEKAAAIKALSGSTPSTDIRIVLLGHDVLAQRHAAKGKDGKPLKSVSVRDRLVDAVKAWGPDGLVVDECHRLKGHASNRSVTHARIARHIPKRIGLTGTVAPNSPLDIFGQWQTINPRRFGTDWSTFKYTYAKWGGFGGNQPIRWINQTTMKKMVALDAIVVKKEDALDLPPVTEEVIHVHLSPKEEQAYQDMEEKAVVALEGEDGVAPSALVQWLRLRQITGGFLGYQDDYGRRKVAELGRSKAKVCIDKVTDLTAAGSKVVVFAHFIHDLDMIEAEIRKAYGKTPPPVYRVSGDTPAKTRLAHRLAFRDKPGPAIFVAQVRTISLAVNELVVAHDAIMYSLSERRDDFLQAIDRLNRIGQVRPVTIWHMQVPDTIDGVILESHRNKTALETAILSYARKKGTA